MEAEEYKCRPVKSGKSVFEGKWLHRPLEVPALAGGRVQVRCGTATVAPEVFVNLTKEVSTR